MTGNKLFGDAMTNIKRMHRSYDKGETESFDNSFNNLKKGLHPKIGWMGDVNGRLLSGSNIYHCYLDSQK